MLLTLGKTSWEPVDDIKVKWKICQMCPAKFAELGRKKFCSGACRWLAWYKRKNRKK